MTSSRGTLARGLTVLAIYVGVVAIATGIAAAAAWTYAPPVGGEWWPYVRAVVTIVAAIVGYNVGSLAAVVAIGSVVSWGIHVGE